MTTKYMPSRAANAGGMPQVSAGTPGGAAGKAGVGLPLNSAAGPGKLGSKAMTLCNKSMKVGKKASTTKGMRKTYL